MISLGSPHVRPMGHTCGEPNEIELTAAHRLFYRSFSGRASYVVVTIRLHVVQADMGRSPTDLLRDHGIRTAKAAATYVPNPAVLFS